MTEKNLPDLSGTKEMVEMGAAQDNLESAFKPLTEMQRLYVDSRLAGLTPYASCKAAGYKDAESHAYKLERAPRVRDALDAASRVARVSLDMSRDDVLEGLMESLQMCATATEMTNVWKEIGKIIGAYQPLKIEHTHNIGDLTNDQMQRLSNKELVSMADQPDAVISVEDDIVDAEFEVLKDAVTPPEPIDYDNQTVEEDDGSPEKDTRV